MMVRPRSMPRLFISLMQAAFLLSMVRYLVISLRKIHLLKSFMGMKKRINLRIPERWYLSKERERDENRVSSRAWTR